MDWERPGRVVRVHDGDTVIVDIQLLRFELPDLLGGAIPDLVIDLGWHVRLYAESGILRLALRQSVRIDGLACPELATPAGKAARSYAEGLLPVGTDVVVVSKQLLGATEKYGRCLADLMFPPAKTPPKPLGSFATAMIAAKQGYPWDGKGKQPTS